LPQTTIMKSIQVQYEHETITFDYTVRQEGDVTYYDVTNLTSGMAVGNRFTVMMQNKQLLISDELKGSVRLRYALAKAILDNEAPK
jgi:hypothetical protein